MRLALRFLNVAFHMTWHIGRYFLLRAAHLFTFDKQARQLKNEALLGSTIRALLQSLGATYIKLGQILSSRPDLLPPYITEELAVLQDRVPPFPFEGVAQIFREDFSKNVDEIFDNFTREPIAAASVAQVHEAYLKSGERVAVKVRRPDIEKTVERDLSIMRFMAGLIETLIPIARRMNFVAQTREFGDAIYAQLDFTVEADNNRRFHENFKELPYVHIPKLHEELCSKQVITMEFIDAVKIDDIVDVIKVPRKDMAIRLFKIYTKMVFDDFFIHADLHPGNILFDDEGNCYILDLGLVNNVREDYLPTFLRFNLAISQRDGKGVARAYVEEYGIQPKDYEAFEADCCSILDELEGKNASDIEFAKYVLDMFKMIRRHHLHMDPNVTLLNVAYLTFEGMSRMFDPQMDVFGIYATEIMRVLTQPKWKDVFQRHFGRAPQDADRQAAEN